MTLQTFLPYPNFSKSAAVLDTKRLGKQIIEAQQVFKAITQPDYGWQSHPAVNMWRGYEQCLVVYAQACNFEWFTRRGKDHGAWTNLLALWQQYVKDNPHDPTQRFLPPWYNDDRFHRSHQSNLLRKDPVHYGQFFDVPDDLPYVWPSKELTWNR